MNIPRGQNPFKYKIGTHSWLIPISLMTAVLGFMLALTWVTKETRKERLGLLAPNQKVRLAKGTLDLSKEYERLITEVKKLREENTKFQNATSMETKKDQLLNQSLQKTKQFAGLTEVEGPGIAISLRDYKGNKPRSPIPDYVVIHDATILHVINELWNAGAEAISVNNHRVVVGTHVRCVGSVILMNHVRLAPPIVIRAIGQPETLLGAVTMPHGIIEDIKNFGHPDMVQIDVIKNMRLPAYAGATEMKHATVVEKP